MFQRNTIPRVYICASKPVISTEFQRVSLEFSAVAESNVKLLDRKICDVKVYSERYGKIKLKKIHVCEDKFEFY